MEYLKDFDFDLRYHLGKENEVANALSRKDFVKAEMMMHSYNLYEKFRDLNLNVAELDSGVLLHKLEISSNLRYRIAQA